MDSTEAQLWSDYWQGRTDAARNAIFEFYLDHIQRFIREEVSNHRWLKADEILSEVAERLLRWGIPGFKRGKLSPTAWFDYCVHKTVAEYIRNAAKQRERDQAIASHLRTHPKSCSEIDIHKFDDAVSRLKPRHAEVVRLYYIQHMTFQEIADSMHLTKQRIQQIIRWSQAFLRKVFQEE